MTISFSRADTSVLSQWWWTVDRWMLSALALLMLVGVVLSLAAGPPVAERLGWDTYHFVQRQAVFLPAAVIALVAVSLFSPIWIRRFATIGFMAAIAAMVLTLFVGPEIKGATRWLPLGPISIQPSEFMKPCFVVVTAWMLSEARMTEGFPGGWIAAGLLLTVISILVQQPDIGMSIVVIAVWATQIFLAGLPIIWVCLFVMSGIGAAVAAYFTFPHVASRVDRFLHPESGDTFQITKSMQAFEQGGWFGRGPGEGRVKENLPDAHTDFIFAVAGEEFGLLLCLVIVCLFAFMVMRAMWRANTGENFFVLLAVSGLAVQFGLQAMINMASSLHLVPTKGMTLPFISYGGSSLLALAVGMGMLLGLTRNQLKRLEAGL